MPCAIKRRPPPVSTLSSHHRTREMPFEGSVEAPRPRPQHDGLYRELT
jgi:hypothetical protein